RLAPLPSGEGTRMASSWKTSCRVPRRSVVAVRERARAAKKESRLSSAVDDSRGPFARGDPMAPGAEYPLYPTGHPSFLWWERGASLCAPGRASGGLGALPPPVHRRTRGGTNRMRRHLSRRTVHAGEDVDSKAG